MNLIGSMMRAKSSLGVLIESARPMSTGGPEQ
jgi:hypothetical protein